MQPPTLIDSSPAGKQLDGALPMLPTTGNRSASSWVLTIKPHWPCFRQERIKRQSKPGRMPGSTGRIPSNGINSNSNPSAEQDVRRRFTEPPMTSLFSATLNQIANVSVVRRNPVARPNPNPRGNYKEGSATTAVLALMQENPTAFFTEYQFRWKTGFSHSAVSGRSAAPETQRAG